MSSASPLHPTTFDAVRELRERFPQTPFLTLGQTTLWDEPMKAAFCLIAEELERAGAIEPGVRVVAGVHDTDYFAKLEGLTIRDTPFVVLRHNDGDTRGLWSAAGEISALFGAEIVPSRGDFTKAGVAFAKAVRAYRGGAEALLNQETDAPLWRAIVHTEPHSLIAADVKLRDIAPALRQQLRFAFNQSLHILGCDHGFEGDETCQARETVRRIWDWNEEFTEQHPDATLSDLYRHLIPKIWGLVRGGTTCNLETTSSLDLFRFNGETATLPRFGFVDVFLNPATRDLARRCYDDAVRGSGIYTLDQFGPGALPFDVVIPGQGRGTLRLHEGKVIVETENPVEICENCDPDSVSRLAALLQSHFGSEICLVGKAVALISMLSAEFLFVFHERASSYTARTQKMNQRLRAAGVSLELHPMLRLQYETWDALGEIESHFVLPPHLERAFGQKHITAHEFAARWRHVAQSGDDLRAKLKSLRAPRQVMQFLGQSHSVWRQREQQYEAAGVQIQAVRAQATAIREQIVTLRQQAREATTLSLQLESQKSAQFRADIAPHRARIADIRMGVAERLNPFDEHGKPRRINKEERAAHATLENEEEHEIARLKEVIEAQNDARRAFDMQIDAHRQNARDLKAQARRQVVEMVTLEKGEITRQARQIRDQIENEAELERLKQVRDAMWASDGLRLTNARPTAWWLPLVSPDGAWFRALAHTAKARIEAL